MDLQDFLHIEESFAGVIYSCVSVCSISEDYISDKKASAESKLSARHTVDTIVLHVFCYNIWITRVSEFIP